MKRYPLLAFLGFCVSVGTGNAQKIATLEVDLSKAVNGIDVVATTDLDDLTFVADSTLSLFLVEGAKRIPVPFQVTGGRGRTLTWLVRSGNGTRRTFELSKGSPSKFDKIEATMKDGALTIHAGERNLLRYMFKTVYPPAGIDTAFRRSGFIHPLWTPGGKELTRIQAPDHYHHYGIWNPWTHVLFEGDTLDFWNLKGRKGTVRFANFVTVTSGPVFSEYAALHHHVAFKKNGPEKVALNELQTVRVYRPEPKQDHFIVDVSIEMSCASDSPFRILEYRYAGLGWRATEKWNQSNSEVLTSEGKTRKDADGTNARWFYVQGALDADYGGAMWMSYPSNYNHPEPLRIWPENSNGGEMFAMFAPTKNKDWLLVPGRTYTLNYRFVVFDGHFSKERAESAWQYYTGPEIAVKKN